MAKTLRILATHIASGTGFANHGDPDPAFAAAVRQTDIPWLPWMYQHHALPLPSAGVGKVNIYYTPEPATDPPSDVLEIASVFETFDASHFLSLPVPDRRRYELDWMHRALARCAAHYGWDRQPFDRSREQILADDFRFELLWKKPVSSPDRKRKAQAVIEVSDRARISLIVSDRSGEELRRVLLYTVPPAQGPPGLYLGRIAWEDAETVRVEQANPRDFWLCPVEGEPEFHFSRAAAGNPHGEFDLGRMYFDGDPLPQDRARGTRLIESAAAKGFKQAIQWLERNARSAATG